MERKDIRLKLYETPTVTDFGSVENLTSAAEQGTHLDFSFAAGTQVDQITIS